MSKQKTIIFACLFIGASLFSLTKAIELFWDKNDLDQQIEKTLKPRISELESNNARISQELKKVQNTLSKTQNTLLDIEEESKVLRQELSSGRYDLKKAKELIKEKGKQLARINNRQNELKGENKLLKDKFNAMLVEFIEMRKTLSSLEALKQAIRDLKISSKKNRRIVRKSKFPRKKSKSRTNRKVSDRKKKTDSEIYGNQGYLIRNGESTYLPKVKIRVLTVDE